VEEIKGLTSNEAKKLLEEFGPNEIIEKKQFLKNYIDAIVMFALLLLNAILGFTEEFRATKAIESLKQKLIINVKVLRDGSWVELPSREIVPQDIIKVSMGDVAPADATIIQGNILVDQSMLIGESIAVERG